ncbi:MAG: GNAT family N-acetyltransferase [Rhodospirillaceae bacterium]|nr:GNAT family N-acetyltransferase [Rhodospirillaceae bacterium]
MTKGAPYEVRVMSRADLDLTLEWAGAEGWNPGRDDARAFHAADPLGYFMGWLGNKPAAAISVVAYDADFAFLGLYIVPPEFRGRGHGFALWREALKRRPARLVGLDGVVAQQANYARSGFRLAYRNVRHGGLIEAKPSGNVPMVPASAVPFDRLAAYDRRFFPAPRPAFLSAWLSPANGAALAAIIEGKIVGLGAIRACRDGFKIGPLFADDERTAEELLLALAARAEGGTVFFDTPEPNTPAVRLAERHGLAPVFETARMYTGDSPMLDLAGTYGVTTFELG